MRLCFLAYKFGTEKEIGEHLGTYNYFIETLRLFVKKGHQVTVVAPWLNFSKKGSKWFSGIKIIRYWPPLFNKIWCWPINKIFRYFYIKQTQKTVLNLLRRENKIETIVVWQARETGFALAQIKNKLNIPLIFRQITAWRWHFERPIEQIFEQRRWYQLSKQLKLNKLLNPLLDYLLARKTQKRYAQTIYQKADKIIFVSQAAVKEGVYLGLKPEKARVVGVAVDDNLFRPTETKEYWRQKLKLKGEKLILFIGRINFAEKGLGVLLESMPTVLRKVAGAKLVIIGGGGESERLNKTINYLGLKENVYLVGRQPLKKLPEFLNAADLLVVPSLWLEHFGQVTIEAMSCARPVITSNQGASPEINIDGQTGFVVSAGDNQQLAKAIIKLLKDDSLCQRLGRQARQRVLREYTYNALTDKFLKIIEESIAAYSSKL